MLSTMASNDASHDTNTAKDSREAFIVVKEGGMTPKHDDSPMDKIVTTARHPSIDRPEGESIEQATMNEQNHRGIELAVFYGKTGS